MSQRLQFTDTPVNPKIVTSAFWAAMLFVFAYIDIFAFWRKDVIEGALAQEVPGVGVAVNQAFLVATTGYILLPSVMVVAVLLLPARIVRPLTITVGVLYILSIVATMIGETWAYYLVGSAAECALLAAMIWYVWRWPRTP